MDDFTVGPYGQMELNRRIAIAQHTEQLSKLLQFTVKVLIGNDSDTHIDSWSRNLPDTA
jgi:hypothetical protein